MGFLKELSKVSVYSVYKKRQLNKLKKESTKIIDDYFQHHTEKRLHIGSGGTVLAGWLNVDLEPTPGKVAYFDAAAVYPFADNTFDYVFSEHLFEHLNLDQQMIMLSEVLRVLKPTGRVRIATPNLDAILNIRNNSSKLVSDYINWSAETFYPQYLAKLGSEVKNEIFVINNYFYSWGHQFIHNPRTLQLLLEKSGYKKIQQVEIYKSDSAVFRNLETHGNIIPSQFNDMETMILEAGKSVEPA